MMTIEELKKKIKNNESLKGLYHGKQSDFYKILNISSPTSSDVTPKTEDLEKILNKLKELAISSNLESKTYINNNITSKRCNCTIIID